MWIKGNTMLSRAEQAHDNLDQARVMRAGGVAYREIGRRLRLTSAQLGLIRRTLKREKAGRTRLLSAGAGDRDLPVMRSALPIGLRRRLVAAGYATLGALADRLDDRARPGLETIAGIGPHKAELVRRMLETFGLLAGSDELRSEIERLFPEFGED